MTCPRRFLADFDNAVDLPIKRVFSVCLVKAMKAGRSGSDESERAEFPQFVLDGVKRQVTSQHQFADVILGRRRGEEQLKKLCPDGWKQHLQNRSLRFQTITMLILTA